MGSRCLMLNAYTPCEGLFAGYPILGEVIDGSSTLSNFNANVRRWMNADALVKIFSTDYGCLENEAMLREMNKIRFSGSFYCSSEVHYAITEWNCTGSISRNVLREGILLCESECRIFVRTLEALFQNAPDACPPQTLGTPEFENRVSLISYFSLFCERSRIRTNPSYPCWNGVSAETSLCGFHDTGFAASYCASNSSDTCCLSPAIPKPSNSSSTSPAAVVSPGTTGTESPSPSVNMVAIAASVSTIVFVLAVAAVGLLYFRLKNNRFPFLSKTDNQKPDDKDPQPTRKIIVLDPPSKEDAVSEQKNLLPTPNPSPPSSPILFSDNPAGTVVVPDPTGHPNSFQRHSVMSFSELSSLVDSTFPTTHHTGLGHVTNSQLFMMSSPALLAHQSDLSSSTSFVASHYPPSGEAFALPETSQLVNVVTADGYMMPVVLSSPMLTTTTCIDSQSSVTHQMSQEHGYGSQAGFEMSVQQQQQQNGLPVVPEEKDLPAITKSRAEN